MPNWRLIGEFRHLFPAIRREVRPYGPFIPEIQQEIVLFTIDEFLSNVESMKVISTIKRPLELEEIVLPAADTTAKIKRVAIV